MTTSSDPCDDVDNVVDTDLDEYGYYEYTLPEHGQGKHSFFRNFQQSRGDNTDINDDDEDDDASISSASFSSSHRGGGKRGSVNNNNVTVSNLDNYPESTCILRCVRCVVLILLLSLMAVLSIVCFVTGTDNDDHDDERVRATSISSSDLGILGLILVVILLFVLVVYDHQARRREEVLQHSAQRSMAVVQSLFPPTVQDRILNADYNISTRKLDIEAGDDSQGGTKRGDGSNFGGIDGKARTSDENKASNKEGGSKIIDRRNNQTNTIKSIISLKSDFLSLGSNHSVDLELDNTADTKRSYSISSDDSNPSKPIADYHPSTTVLFADVVGFTAWSSVRDPAQVFQLLEAIYGAFDAIARKKGVFKVETIGDCYVAAAGLPTPCDDHAVVMATFARRCLDKMLSLVIDLEVTLGPGTAELGMRFGLHSGPTIGGVLRGTKARYQLYGDTMNTAARIESSSMKNKIHLSEQTADLLKRAGKEKWVVPRDEKVVAKGKGELQTYWLCVDPPKNLTREEKLALPILLKMMAKANVDPGFCPTKESIDRTGKAKDRLVDYNTKVLEDFLKKIVATRTHHDNLAVMLERTHGQRVASQSMRYVLKETHNDILLPTFDRKDHFVTDPSTVDLGDRVISQLRHFVNKIASSYNDKPFHCFEHASHTILSVTKLFTSIDSNTANDGKDKMLRGMLMDPLTQFSVALAALVHDAGYDVPTSQLVREQSELTSTYGSHSVAEQHSIDIAWSTLMESSFQDLRGCIYQTEEELERFRSVLTHTVMATDISNPNAAADRRARWEQAFVPTVVDRAEQEKSSEERVTTQKAFVVIDHIIQLSDVSHALQHWSVFSKWNRQLFKEQYLDFKAGRAEQNPSADWYKNELMFFDNHILPLATRFQEIKMFGAGSTTYLKNAASNRQDWEQGGNAMVEEYLDEISKKSSVASSFEKNIKRATGAIKPS